MFTSLEQIRADMGPRAASSRVVIFSDFDGTISNEDSLKLLLNRYADSHWPVIEQAMSIGELPERLGLQQSFDHLHMSFESALRFVLREVRLDPYFKNFAQWVGREGHELSILSGGFENFIRPLLEREGLSGLKLLANQVQVQGGSWKVNSCKIERLCSLCNHCKSASLVNELMKDPDVFLIYVGDGLTDTCAIQLADLVFAKGYLAKYCAEKEVSHIAFNDFSEVSAQLHHLLSKPAVQVAA